MHLIRKLILLEVRAKCGMFEIFLCADDSMIQEELDDAYQVSLGNRPALPFLGPDYQRMMELCTACTDESPHGRPSAQQIVLALQDLV